jgi:hypothetical protein
MTAERGKRARDRAIAKVAEANAEWIERAIALLRSALTGQSPFGSVFITTDDIWAALDKDVPTEPRAMGALMCRAQKEALVEPLADWRLSKRAACHRRPLRVWRLLVAKSHPDALASMVVGVDPGIGESVQVNVLATKRGIPTIVSDAEARVFARDRWGVSGAVWRNRAVCFVGLAPAGKTSQVYGRGPDWNYAFGAAVEGGH